MDRLTKNRILVVWLFLAIFSLPFVVKTVHIYHLDEEHGCCADANHHDSGTCPVCQFTLSSFTESPLFSYDFKVTVVYSKPYISFCDKIYRHDLNSYGLRAPPVI